MVSMSRNLGLFILVAASGSAARAEQPATISGYFYFKDGAHVESHRSSATITISFNGNSAVAKYADPGPGNLPRYTAAFPTYIPGPYSIAGANKPPFPVTKGMQVDVATDGRHNTAELNQDVPAAPAGSHNELSITMEKKGTGKYQLQLAVVAAKN